MTTDKELIVISLLAIGTTGTAVWKELYAPAQETKVQRTVNVTPLSNDYSQWMRDNGYRTTKEILEGIMHSNNGNQYGCRVITEQGNVYTLHYNPPHSVALEALLIAPEKRGGTFIFRMKEDGVLYPLWPQSVEKNGWGHCPPAEWLGLITAAEARDCATVYKIGVAGVKEMYKAARAGKCDY